MSSEVVRDQRTPARPRKARSARRTQRAAQRGRARPALRGRARLGHQPAGPVRRGRGAARRPACSSAPTPTASTCSCASPATAAARAPRAVRRVDLRAPPPGPAGRCVRGAAASTDDARTPTCAAPPPARCSPGREVKRDPGPARPRPAAPRRRPGAGLGPGLPQPAADRRAADGPVGGRRRRQRLPRRGAVPAPASTRSGRAVTSTRSEWDAAVGRPGDADARRRAHRPDRHHPAGGPRPARGPGAAEDAHYVYRRTGLPCRVCGTPVAHRGDGGPQPVLVPRLPAALRRRGGRRSPPFVQPAP